MNARSDTLVVPFADPLARDIAISGGKGSNLAALTAAGLAVPPGFCVTTHAYTTFSAAIGLDERVELLLSVLGEDAADVETHTADLRRFIIESIMPASVVQSILDAYGAMEPGAFVAVRSSGTAEDLAGSSFAGLHDTYLDIRGEDALLDAVKRCWASMWTARATSYRRTKGFDQTQARIAVVVQKMVEADVAGVMFTANPMTAATDEIVINAAYGLGEALVSGIATPDEHLLDLNTLKVKEQRLGAKEVSIVRDRSRNSGTIEQQVPEVDRQRFALTDMQIKELGELGRQVMALYNGFPQDIEWAIEKDRLYLLQARPVTGVNLSWDDHLEFWQVLPEDENTLWTRSWADEVWNGAISPLCYSYRGLMFTNAAQNCARLCGIEGGLPARMYRYYKGEAYYSADVGRLFVESTTLDLMRPGLLAHTPPDAAEQILARRFDVLDWVKMHLNIVRLGYGPYKWLEIAEDYLNNRIAEADGPADDELRAMDDKKLAEALEYFVNLKVQFNKDLWTGFFIYARDAVGLLSALVNLWYDGKNAGAFADLFSGLPRTTATARENMALWQFSQRIRDSKVLRTAFNAAGSNYLKAFESSAEGRAFLADYRAFAMANAHRGAADRDPYFSRRGDDPGIDYENFKTLLASTAAIDPEERERQVNARRNTAIADIEAHLSRRSFGPLRVTIFKKLLDYAYRFFFIRDEQRYYHDRYTYGVRRAALEIGARLARKGVLERADDAFFLGRQELYRLLVGDLSDLLTAQKIAGRRHNFDLMLKKQAAPPAYLRRGRPVSFARDDEGGLKGVGTSRGVVTGHARVVKELRNIGQLGQGDILVTESTDPGWTPVFNLISGIVLETGGMLAHGSCLAREYGFPAVQLAGATQLIADGSLITVNGDTGEVLLVDEGDQE